MAILRPTAISAFSQMYLSSMGICALGNTYSSAEKSQAFPLGGSGIAVKNSYPWWGLVM